MACQCYRIRQDVSTEEQHVFSFRVMRAERSFQDQSCYGLYELLQALAPMTSEALVFKAKLDVRNKLQENSKDNMTNVEH